MTKNSDNTEMNQRAMVRDNIHHCLWTFNWNILLGFAFCLKKKIKEKSQEGTRQKITPAGVKGRVKGKGVGEAWLFSLAGRKIASSSRCTGFLSRFIFMSSGKQHKFSDC